MRHVVRFLLLAALLPAMSVGWAAPPSVIVDSAGHQLIRVEAGVFMMGGAEPAENVVRAFPEAGLQAATLADEYPRHPVRITRAFLLSRYETTIGQFRRFVGETGYRTEAEIDELGGWGYNLATRKSEGRRPHFNWMNPGYPQTDDHPVVNVSYNDVTAYLAWLSAREGHRYRLPTEAEWEYANRAGGTARYANGNDPAQLTDIARGIDLSRQQQFGHVQDLQIEPGDPSAFPLPVGRLAPNAWGFHDMHGNVWEWVSDWYGENYYRESPVDDPQGPATGEVRVRRGGGWNSFPVWLRTSFRNINTPVSRCLNLGFRVAREL